MDPGQIIVFPLVATNPVDFKPLLVHTIVPLIMAFGTLAGLCIVGIPGVGKTPLGIALAMAFWSLASPQEWLAPPGRLASWQTV